MIEMVTTKHKLTYVGIGGAMLVASMFCSICAQADEPGPEITAANFRRLLSRAVDDHSQRAIALRIHLESWIRETNDEAAIKILGEEADASVSESPRRYSDVLQLLLAAESMLGRQTAKACLVSRLKQFEKDGVSRSWRGPRLGVIMHGLAQVNATEELGRTIGFVKVDDEMEMAFALSAVATNGSKDLIPVLLGKREELGLITTVPPQAIAKIRQKIDDLIISISSNK